MELQTRIFFFGLINMNFLKEAHTAIFLGQTGCGKTHLVLNLVEYEYRGHFNYIAVHLSDITV